MKVSTGIRGRRYFYSWPKTNVLSRTKSRDPPAHDMTRFNFEGKTFSDILPRSSVEAFGWWSAAKQWKWRFVVGQNQRQKKWNNPEQRNVKIPATESLNCSLQSRLSAVMSIIFSSETLILRTYWHSGKLEAEAALQIIKCVKMHLLRKRGPKANNKRQMEINHWMPVEAKCK